MGAPVNLESHEHRRLYWTLLSSLEVCCLGFSSEIINTALAVISLTELLTELPMLEVPFLSLFKAIFLEAFCRLDRRWCLSMIGVGAYHRHNRSCFRASCNLNQT